MSLRLAGIGVVYQVKVANTRPLFGPPAAPAGAAPTSPRKPGGTVLDSSVLPAAGGRGASELRSNSNVCGSRRSEAGGSPASEVAEEIVDCLVVAGFGVSEVVANCYQIVFCVEERGAIGNR